MNLVKQIKIIFTGLDGKKTQRTFDKATNVDVYKDALATFIRMGEEMGLTNNAALAQVVESEIVSGRCSVENCTQLNVLHEVNQNE